MARYSTPTADWLIKRIIFKKKFIRTECRISNIKSRKTAPKYVENNIK